MAVHPNHLCGDCADLINQGWGHEMKNRSRGIRAATAEIREKLAVRPINAELILKYLVLIDNLTEKIEVTESPFWVEEVHLNQRITSLQGRHWLVNDIEHPVLIEPVLDPDCPPILANKTWLDLLLVELIRNSVAAFQDLPPGLQRRHYIRVQTMVQHSRTILAVTDNGPGIPSENLAGFFKKPVQERQDGHGIGLRNVKEFIECWGGEVELENVEGAGLRVLLRFQSKDTR